MITTNKLYHKIIKVNKYIKMDCHEKQRPKICKRVSLRGATLKVGDEAIHKTPRPHPNPLLQGEGTSES